MPPDPLVASVLCTELLKYSVSCLCHWIKQHNDHAEEAGSKWYAVHLHNNRHPLAVCTEQAKGYASLVPRLTFTTMIWQSV